MVITGPAGCGKSFLLEKIRKYCNESMINIALTALTGAAASLIGGTTLHGWAGIGLGKGSAQEIHTGMVKKKHPSLQKWMDVRVLVIDEISMMDASLFNKLHILGQIIRGNKGLFGGVQVILCGDFAQLKPIVDGGSFLFAFESSVWKEYLGNSVHYLDRVIRQADPDFQALLGRTRLGVCTEEDKKLLNSRLITDLANADLDVVMPDGSKKIICSTLLYPRKKDVCQINDMKLEELLSTGISAKTYSSLDTVVTRRSRTQVQLTDYHQKAMDTCISAPAKLVLCVGAQVMLIKNLDIERGLVNGSRGIVTRIDGGGLPVVLFDNGEELPMDICSFESESGENIYVRKQVPLILAWALTIHKCQGASLSSVITDLSDVFDEAQVYVTLSRARSLDGLFIIGLDYSRIKCNPRVRKYYENLLALQCGEKI